MAGFLRRNTWLVPLALAAGIAAVGYTTLRALEKHELELLRSQVETTVASASEALGIWAAENESTASFWGNEPRVAALTQQLAEIGRRAEDPPAALLAAPALAELRAILDPVTTHQGYMGWGIQGPTGRMIAAETGLDHYLGFVPAQLTDFHRRALEGWSGHTQPMIFEGPKTPYATIIAGAPVRSADGQAVGGLGFTLNPSEEFARLLEVARMGKSGETYAFDANGVMVSPSRFEDRLREIGLLPEDPEISSALTIQVRDPGGDLTKGHAPEAPLAARGLTLAAASAIDEQLDGKITSNLDGYRDYRGIRVVGAWTWIPALHIGIASELDAAEAFAGLSAVRWRFGVLLALLTIATLGMLGYSRVLMRLRGKVEENRKLGRYRLQKKLGEGGMGSVYLAKHALLRRPTAIKVLDAEAAGDEGIARFEREVQVSSSLSHPNTIQIFDFGTTHDGTFYYAMEHVSGLTIAKLVASEGALPEERVLYILRQVAGSLAEAHSRQLAHRDIKPANLMLCERGGNFDFVKVLDFGLVRLLDQSDDLAITKTQNLTGTPLYMAPEAIENPKSLDARSDVYQLGAVAYYMLTGRPPFEGDTLVEVLSAHMTQAPTPLSEAATEKVSPELESIVMRCLEKDPQKRFADAGDLKAAFESCPKARGWTQVDARAWWANWVEEHPTELEDPDPTIDSGASGYSIDLVRRLTGTSRD
jgi:hypothetical protein